jgi:hypothetical protein
MTYSTNASGEGILTLSPEEKRLFKSGAPVVKRSGDGGGHFKITVKLTRPRSKAARFRGL